MFRLILEKIRTFFSGDGVISPVTEKPRGENGLDIESTATFIDKKKLVVPPKSADEVISDMANRAGWLSIEIVDVGGNVDEVTDHIKRQAEISTDLKRDATQMLDSTEKIKGAVENSLQVTEAAKADVHMSREKIDTSLAEIGSLAEAVTAIEAQLGSVNYALTRVVKEVQGIASIAGKTNILALNATIEASHVGSEGRSFGVVANEVKALANRTTRSTERIENKIRDLTREIGQLMELSAASTAKAEAVHNATESIGTMIETVGTAMTSVDEEVDLISFASTEIENRCRPFIQIINDMADGVMQSSVNLEQARRRINRLISVSENLLRITVMSDVNTVDTPFIQKAIETAAQISKEFETAIETQAIRFSDQFDVKYVPIEDTQPQQYMTRFVELTDAVLPKILEPVLEWNGSVAFCVAVDRNGYLPTHNKKYSKPQRKNLEYNKKHCRNRQIFDDRVGISAARNTRSFLLQTYRRDMGNGQFALMKDASAPIIVKGRHWGALRIGYTM